MIVCLLAGSRAFSLAIVIAHRYPVGIYILGLVLRSAGRPFPALGGFGALLRSAPRGGRSALGFCASTQCSAALAVARSRARPLWVLVALYTWELWRLELSFIFLFFLVLDDVWPHQRLSIARLLSSQIYFTLWFSTSLALLASVPLDYSGARHHRS